MTEEYNLEQQNFGIRVAFKSCDVATKLCQFLTTPDGFSFVETQQYNT